MTDVIIGIHGLANKPDDRTLSDWWEASIREGLNKNLGVHDADFDYVMVYWADLLYKSPQHQDVAFDFDSQYNSQPYVEARHNALKEYTEGWLDSARAAASAIGGSALDSIRGYVGLDTVADWILGQKLKDLDFYYDSDRQIRDRNAQMRRARDVLMDELMSALLPLKGRRLMLIAHSMGSIVAYDVLRNLGQRDSSFPVHQFVTIGSPLGMPHVKANIHGERSHADSPVRTPTVVTEGWVNYADRGDPVAVDTHLRDDFTSNSVGVRVQDDLVVNDYVSPIGDKNSHKSYGYLRTPEISRLIKQFLGG